MVQPTSPACGTASKCQGSGEPTTALQLSCLLSRCAESTVRTSKHNERSNCADFLSLVISFYSSTIFEAVLQDSDKALFASLGYGAVQVVFTIPTLFLIDTKGRRTLTLITFPIMAIFLLAAGLATLMPETASAGARLGPVVL